MYRTNLTSDLFEHFVSDYQSLPLTSKEPQQPFVYVDASGMKLVTSVVEEDGQLNDGVFAVSVAQDGWVEMLAFVEAAS